MQIGLTPKRQPYLLFHPLKMDDAKMATQNELAR